MLRTCIFLLFACSTFAQPRGVLDGVITNAIEKLRPQLEGLVLPDIDAAINASAVLANLTTTNITTAGLDLFVIEDLNTSLFPIALDILTLHWDEVNLTGPYSLSGVVDIEQLQGPIELNSTGMATVTVRNLNFTVGCVFQTLSGHIQVKEMTLLSARLEQSIIDLEHIFDGGDMDLIVNVFLSFFLPEFINDQGDELLLAIEPIIIDAMNKILADSDFPLL